MKQIVINYKTDATSGTGIAYPEFTPGFQLGFVLLDHQFYVYVLQIVVCRFVLFHLAIVMSVLPYTDSDYPFGIFKLYIHITTDSNGSYLRFSFFLSANKNLIMNGSSNDHSCIHCFGFMNSKFSEKAI